MFIYLNVLVTICFCLLIVIERLNKIVSMIDSWMYVPNTLLSAIYVTMWIWT